MGFRFLFLLWRECRFAPFWAPFAAGLLPPFCAVYALGACAEAGAITACKEAGASSRVGEKDGTGGLGCRPITVQIVHYTFITL